jgi:ligand-binding SRPBCC domain-containing protein
MTDRNRTGTVTISSHLAAPSEQVWQRITTPEGINHELRPIMRMTLPRGADSLDLDSVPSGTPIGRSWVLLFGLIPFDYSDLCIERLEPGVGFLERSKMLQNEIWEHERTLEPNGDGCVLTDRLRFKPRGPFSGRVEQPIIRAIFRHRHKRLRRWFADS